MKIKVTFPIRYNSQPWPGPALVQWGCLQKGYAGHQNKAVKKMMSEFPDLGV